MFSIIYIKKNIYELLLRISCFFMLAFSNLLISFLVHLAENKYSTHCDKWFWICICLIMWFWQQRDRHFLVVETVAIQVILKMGTFQNLQK